MKHLCRIPLTFLFTVVMFLWAVKGAFALQASRVYDAAADYLSSNNEGDALIVRGGKTEVGFDRASGRIVFIHDLSTEAKGSVAASPAEGDLWTLKTRSGKTWSSHAYSVKATQTGDNDLTLAYDVEGGTVHVHVAGS